MSKSKTIVGFALALTALAVASATSPLWMRPRVLRPFRRPYAWFVGLRPLRRRGRSERPGARHAAEGPARRAAVRKVPGCNTLLLHNHGFVCFGASVREVWVLAYYFERACEIQIKAQAGGGALVHVPEAIVQGIQAQAARVTLGQGGALAWPALLRKADRLDPGFRD